MYGNKGFHLTWYGLAFTRCEDSRCKNAIAVGVTQNEMLLCCS